MKLHPQGCNVYCCDGYGEPGAPNPSLQGMKVDHEANNPTS